MQRDASFLRAWAASAPGADVGDDDAGAGTPAASLPNRRFRSLWISDLHLGTPGCQANALLDFLRRTECETLYLVGDIVDGWQLRRSWFWPQAHNDVVQKLLRKARKGTRVVFVPGNHDEFARRYIGHSFGGIDVVDEWLHVTADGKRLWVTHGDLCDGVIQCARWLAHVGDHVYEFLLRLNARLNSMRARAGLPYWSLSRYLKLKVKRAVSYVGAFEETLAREAKKRGADGVVCGHIHHAEAAAEPRRLLRRRRRVRPPEQDRHLRPRHARGHGVRNAGGGVPGRGAARRRRRFGRRRARCRPAARRAACARGSARACASARRSVRPRPRRARVRRLSRADRASRCGARIASAQPSRLRALAA